VFFFALILIIQFTAMMFHRFGTISHILASTDLNLTCSKKSEELSQDALIDKVRRKIKIKVKFANIHTQIPYSMR
jgi:hypothetical protein